MDVQTTLPKDEIKIGDQVFLTERSFTNETRLTTATIVDVRYILGRISYVIETEGGKRKVVGSAQVSRVTE